MSDELQRKLVRHFNLQSYLSQLSLLAGRNVTEDELSATEAVDDIRQSFLKKEMPTGPKFKISHSDLSGDGLQAILADLYRLNPSGIHIWIEHVDECGILRLDNIASLHFNFSIDAISNGIIGITTTDSNDRMVVDLDNIVEVELFGLNWSRFSL